MPPFLEKYQHLPPSARRRHQEEIPAIDLHRPEALPPDSDEVFERDPISDAVSSLGIYMLEENLRKGESITIPSLGIEIFPDTETMPELFAEEWYEKLGQRFVELRRKKDNYHFPKAESDPRVILNSEISPLTRYILHALDDKRAATVVDMLRPMVQRFISKELTLVPNTVVYERAKNIIRHQLLKIEETPSQVKQLNNYLEYEEETYPRALAEVKSNKWTELLQAARVHTPKPGEEDSVTQERENPLPKETTDIVRFLLFYADETLPDHIKWLPDDVRELIVAELATLPGTPFLAEQKRLIKRWLRKIPTQLANAYRRGDYLDSALFIQTGVLAANGKPPTARV